jgi:dihydrofolate reductase
MKAILAVNNLGFIGLNNGLPWGTQAKADFRHFKAFTMGETLLVGYNTFQTLPPLKGRTIVLDERDKLMLDGITICIGGKKTYEKYAPYFTELHISHIDDNSIGDTMMPDLSKLNPACRIHNYFFQLG